MPESTATVATMITEADATASGAADGAAIVEQLTAIDPAGEAEPAKPSLSLELILACEVASGQLAADATATARMARGAYGSWNSRGTKGVTWYRMVWRDGSWSYFADGRLTRNKWNGKLEGSERGAVYAGEILCEHNIGGEVDTVYLVSDEPDGDTPWSLHRLDWKRTRAGLLIMLPTGAHVTLPNPRGRGK